MSLLSGARHFRQVVDREQGGVVCETCLLAETASVRVKGLLGRRELPPGEGLLLRPAAAIHTWFMRFPIDVVFLDRDLVVIGVVQRLRPWRLAARRGARGVLELAAGECERRGIASGQRLAFGDAETATRH